jgi:toluene monooxygenase system ferredoxin subunit
MAFQWAARIKDLWDGEMQGLVVAGCKVLLVNLEGKIQAYENRCAHLGVPLSEGRLAGSRLQCRAHQWEYSLITGQGLNPASARLKRLPVKVEGEDILVDVGGENP